MKNNTKQRQSSAFKNTIIGGLLGLLSALMITLLSSSGLLKQTFDSYEAKTYDARFKYHVKQNPPLKVIDEIIIVDIDPFSIKKLGNFRRWPHDYFARVIENISRSQPLAIGVDIIFDPETDPKRDSLLIAATEKSGLVFHAISFSQEDPDNFLYRMDEEPEGLMRNRFAITDSLLVQQFPDNDVFDGYLIPLLNASAGIGSVNFPPDPDGVIRHLNLYERFRQRLYPSLAVAIYTHLFNLVPLGNQSIPDKQFYFVQKATGRKFFLPVEDGYKMLINYQGYYHTFRYIPFYHVLRNRFPPGIFQNRIALIGTSTPGLFDLRATPVQETFPGVEIHANALYTLMNADFLQRPEQLISLAIIFISSLILALSFANLRPFFALILLILFNTIYIGCSYFLFQKWNLVMPLIKVNTSTLLTFIGVFLFRYIVVDRDKRQIRNMFSTYISSKVLRYLEEHPEAFRLTGERRIATIFFSDIANFTTISERLSPEELARLLNEYLSPMTEILMSYDGYVDKYEGDAIMCEFGVPMPDPEHAVKACLAALDQQEELKRLRPVWQEKYGVDIHVRMGINSGEVSAGNMGSNQRFQYTVMGDAVNQASRFEGANKEFGTYIMIGETTYQLAKEKVEVRLLDKLRVKGKTRPVFVYELLGRKGDVETSRLKIKELFEEGLQHYWERNWTMAIEKFQQVLAIEPEDGPAQTFLQRCHHFLATPPPEEWQGEFSMTTK